MADLIVGQSEVDIQLPADCSERLLLNCATLGMTMTKTKTTVLSLALVAFSARGAGEMRNNGKITSCDFIVDT